jgi:hypothetical protein
MNSSLFAAIECNNKNGDGKSSRLAHMEKAWCNNSHLTLVHSDDQDPSMNFHPLILAVFIGEDDESHCHSISMQNE